MRTARYTNSDGKPFDVDYDENAPCRICGLPVGEASTGGTDVCPSCDCGYFRDGERISLFYMLRPDKLRRAAKEKWGATKNAPEHGLQPHDRPIP